MRGIAARVGVFLFSCYAWLLLVPATLTGLIVSRVALLFAKKRRAGVFFRCAGPVVRVWSVLTGIRFRLDTSLFSPDPNDTFVLVGNHTSFLDLLAVTAGIRRDFRVLSKVENRRIPIFGYTIAPALVTVDRSSAESRQAGFQTLNMLLQSGTSVMVFPEGTRNRDPDAPLGPRFYDGAFRVAHDHQTDLLPVVITGTRHAMPGERFWLRPGVVGIHYLPPISAADRSVDELRDLSYERLAAGVCDLDPHFAAERIQPGV